MMVKFSWYLSGSIVTMNLRVPAWGCRFVRRLSKNTAVLFMLPARQVKDPRSQLVFLKKSSTIHIPRTNDLAHLLDQFT